MGRWIGAIPTDLTLKRKRRHLAHPLAPAHGRGAVGRPRAGKHDRRRQDRSGQTRRLHLRHYRYHGAGEGDHLPDRRQADAHSPPEAGAPGEESGRRSAPELRAGWQACAGRAAALRPRQAFQPGEPGAQGDPHHARPGHPRYRPAHPGRAGLGSRLRPAAHARPPGPRPGQAQHSSRSRSSLPLCRKASMAGSNGAGSSPFAPSQASS